MCGWKDPMMDTMTKCFIEAMKEERASGDFIPKVGFASAEKPRVRRNPDYFLQSLLSEITVYM